MKISQLKEIVKKVVSEETEYQQLFMHMLDKTGKDIGSMSDDETTKFFNAVDRAYKAKSEGKLKGYNENVSYKSVNEANTRLLKKVIAIVEDEYAKGNKNDVVSLMNTVSDKTGYKAYDARANYGPASGMKGFRVGFDVVVSLADNSKYKSVLSKEDVKYTIIGNWYIGAW
jgi:hypothetical protein